MKVTIDRASWNTGSRYGTGVLLSNRNHIAQQHLCCLGFLGRACGISDEFLQEAAFPHEVGFEDKWPKALPNKSDAYMPVGPTGRRWKWEETLAEMNDVKGIDDATREAWIAEGFRTVLGVDVEFVGSYPEVTP